jgi:hypothetical protein
MSKINNGISMNKILNNAFVLIILIAVIIVILIKAHFYYKYTSEERFFYKSLKNIIKQQEKNFNIPIYQLTNFDWNKMWYFGPYNYRLKEDGVTIQGKYYKNNCSNTPKLDNDGMWALVFIKDDVIRYIIRGNIIGYSKIDTEPLFYKNNDLMVMDNESRFYFRRIK